MAFPKCYFHLLKISNFMIIKTIIAIYIGKLALLLVVPDISVLIYFSRWPSGCRVWRLYSEDGSHQWSGYGNVTLKCRSMTIISSHSRLVEIDVLFKVRNLLIVLMVLLRRHTSLNLMPDYYNVSPTFKVHSLHIILLHPVFTRTSSAC